MVPMKESDITFPVLCKHKNTIFSVRTCDALTNTTTAAIRGGLFECLYIIDSSGRTFTVTNATVLHGIGPVWGFNVFFNRKVKVKLEMQENFEKLGVDDVRRLVLRDFRNWHGWQSREDFAALKKNVSNASSVSEIIGLVSS